MDLNERRELILRLKKFKQEHEISNERAAEMVIAIGEPSSESTAKRVFRAGSEDHADSFRLDTLKAFERAFFGDPSEPVPTDETVSVLKETVAVLRDQNDRIRRALVTVSAILGVVLLAIIGLLVFDLLNRDIGYFQDAARRVAEMAANRI